MTTIVPVSSEWLTVYLLLWWGFVFRDEDAARAADVDTRLERINEEREKVQML